jgi:hypothetical protein
MHKRDASNGSIEQAQECSGDKCKQELPRPLKAVYGAANFCYQLSHYFCVNFFVQFFSLFSFFELFDPAPLTYAATIYKALKSNEQAVKQKYASLL